MYEWETIVEYIDKSWKELDFDEGSFDSNSYYTFGFNGTQCVITYWADDEVVIRYVMPECLNYMLQCKYNWGVDHHRRKMVGVRDEIDKALGVDDE